MRIQLKDGQLHPIYTDLPPAPPCLLDVIRCNCKSDCKILRCSCCKTGLRCSYACCEGRGIACTNSTVMKPVTDGDDETDVGTNTEGETDGKTLRKLTHSYSVHFEP